MTELMRREPVFRMVTRWLWRLRPQGPFPELEPTIEILADPRASAGPEAGLAMAICLSLNDVGLRTFTAETIAAAITTGSATGAWLGAGLSRALLEYRYVDVGPGAVPRRWVDPLADIACTSDRHAHAVHTALQVLLASAPPSDRSRLSGILGLLRHLTLTYQRPVDNEDARRFLGALSPRSQGGQIAQEILTHR
jgi:hypothetical protein